MTLEAWREFEGEDWRRRIDVAAFIRRNYTPYEGDAGFLSGPTARTTALWHDLGALLAEERRRGVYDVDTRTPSGITSHRPGYIDRDRELIVGLQTDAPLRRAILPNGGIRMVQAAADAYGYTLDPGVVETFTRHRKTHNDGVFDAYTEAARKARRTHIITGLPDAYGRGRIIGDYRRVPLYGVDRLVADRVADRERLDLLPSSPDVIRDREELAEQVRALRELAEMAATYGYDISGPATTAR
ncbi:MAG TPA: pyruvate formate lyase family protein, partial [Micromonosporaceae bacterium]|nr:pyruvate formate lyase family protein [Micromonosporaceae bacterium]